MSPEHNFKSMKKLIKFNIMYKVSSQRSSHCQLMSGGTITKTCISSKKRKKMLSPYWEIALRKIKSIELHKKVIHNIGIANILIWIQRDWNPAEWNYCQNN